jgi:hypothetical protein
VRRGVDELREHRQKEKHSFGVQELDGSRFKEAIART